MRDRVAAQASSFWSTHGDDMWEANSHWRNRLGDEAFFEVGTEHKELFDQFAAALGTNPGGIVIEWGCGGGANAVAFAPQAEKFIGADITEESLAECRRQVQAVCSTPVETRRIDLAAPENAIAGLDDTCAVFLCLYVFELTTGRAEVERILRIASRVLTADGMALVQVKYHTADPRTRGRTGLLYERTLAMNTTFSIDGFWTLAADCGLTPRLLTLVPENRFDKRYAYYALTKAPAARELS